MDVRQAEEKIESLCTAGQRLYNVLQALIEDLSEETTILVSIGLEVVGAKEEWNKEIDTDPKETRRVE